MTKLPAQRPVETVDEEPPHPRPSAGRRPKPPTVSMRSATALEPVDEAPAPPPRSPVLAIGVAVAVAGVLVGAGLFVALARSPADEPPPPVTPPPLVEATRAPAPVVNVVVKLSAEPASARFEVDGEKMDGNPLVLTRAKDTGVAVIASAPGHEPKSLRLIFSETREERLALTPREPGSEPAPERPTATAPAKPGKSPKATAPKKPGGKLTVDETNPYE